MYAHQDTWERDGSRYTAMTTLIRNLDWDAMSLIPGTPNIKAILLQVEPRQLDDGNFRSRPKPAPAPFKDRGEAPGCDPDPDHSIFRLYFLTQDPIMAWTDLSMMGFTALPDHEGTAVGGAVREWYEQQVPGLTYGQRFKGHLVHEATAEPENVQRVQRILQGVLDNDMIRVAQHPATSSGIKGSALGPDTPHKQVVLEEIRGAAQFMNSPRVLRNQSLEARRRVARETGVGYPTSVMEKHGRHFKGVSDLQLEAQLMQDRIDISGRHEGGDPLPPR